MRQALGRQPVLFVQGAGDMWEPEGSGVLARYLEESLGPDFDVVAPEMPDTEAGPSYRQWRDLIDGELRRMDGPVVLIGHSFGGSVLLKYLAEGRPPVEVRGLFLVAATFWGPGGWEYEEYDLPSDFATKLPQVPTFLYHSREDPHVPYHHFEIYRRLLPNVMSRPIDGSEHSFMNGLPELVEDIRQLVVGREA